jgi:hypothetical protein
LPPSLPPTICLWAEPVLPFCFPILLKKKHKR